MSATLWMRDDSTFRTQPVDGPLRITPDRPWSAPGEGDAGALLLPVAPVDGVRAVLIVPEGAEAAVLRNGELLPPGLHALQHADRVTVDGQEAWLAAATEPGRTVYDPERHGEGVRCGRTKLRLSPGDEIVRCPGTERDTCGLLSRASAWDLGRPCPSCGHAPDGPRWEPPDPGPAARTRALLKQVLDHATL